MADNDDCISTLNNLIETARDGQNGFLTAAEGVRNSELKELFLTYSRQRAQFVGDLQDEVRRLGGEPVETGSISATLHRGWMNIRAAVSGEDEAAVISECERGEDAAVSTYRGALDADLPANVRALVERQYRHVREAHERIRALEKATNAGA